jgi:mono/diheme cytochrome c family protein
MILVAAGCQAKKVSPVARGRIIYMANCVVCHNADPNLAGSQGPPIAGSSRELVAARVLHLSYPKGYVPKRNTHAMRAIPTLEPEIDNLTAFLAAARNQQADAPGTSPP